MSPEISGVNKAASKPIPAAKSYPPRPVYTPPELPAWAKELAESGRLTSGGVIAEKNYPSKRAGTLAVIDLRESFKRNEVDRKALNKLVVACDDLGIKIGDVFQNLACVVGLEITLPIHSSDLQGRLLQRLFELEREFELKNPW